MKVNLAGFGNPTDSWLRVCPAGLFPERFAGEDFPDCGKQHP